MAGKASSLIVSRHADRCRRPAQAPSVQWALGAPADDSMTASPVSLQLTNRLDLPSPSASVKTSAQCNIHASLSSEWGLAGAHRSCQHLPSHISVSI